MGHIAQPTIGQLKIRRTKPGILASAVALGVAAMPAAAQQANETPTQLPAISVEGQRGSNPATDYKIDQSASPKFTAPLLDTPKTVTVIPQAVMQERAALSMQEVLRTQPGITLGAGEGGTPNGDRPVIRGFESTTDMYVDGLRDTGSQTRDTFNLEQVEIVKGPSGAFAGRGSTGGSINMISKTAKAEDFRQGSVTLGTDMTKRVTTDVNEMISENIAVRLNAMYHDGDVAGRDEVEVNRWGFAPSVTLGLNKPTNLTLSYYHLQTDDIPDYGHPYDPRTGKPVVVDRDNFYGLTNRDFSENTIDAVTAQFEHEFNDRLKLRNGTRVAYSQNNYIVTNPNDSAPNNIANGYVWRSPKGRNSDTLTFVNQTDLLGDFETGSVKHNYIVGIELSRENVENRGYNVAAGGNAVQCTAAQIALYNCTPLYNPTPNDPWSGAIGPAEGWTHTTTNTQAIYAFDTLELNEQWSLNLGLRFDNYVTHANGLNVRGATRTPVAESNHSQFVNYQTGVVYKPAPNGSIYVAYSTSSNPVGATAGEGDESISATNSRLEPEENVNYELGTKWDLLNNRLSLTGAVFQIEKKNARAATAPGNNAPLDNVGEVQVRGFEIGASGNITPLWKVFGGYTFLDSEIVDDGAFANNQGKEFPNTPNHSFSLWSTYDILRDVTVGGGATYVAKRYGNAANTLSVPNYWRFDAMAAYKLNESVDFQLNVINLFDETYYEKPYSTHMASVGAGRAALLTTNFKF